jgi:excisionase family DNA binding protein
MTVREAAQALGMSARAIRNRIERGEMKATLLGSHMWVIPREEIERWRPRGRLKPGPKRHKEAENTGG